MAAVSNAFSPRCAFASSAALGVVVLVLLAGILALNDGAFGYVLDDAYIHLALAENLAGGHYGINLEEPSSPSSSILYPFLLAAGFRLGLGQTGPLVLNLLALLGTTALVIRVMGLSGLLDRPGSGARAAVLGTAVVLATNGVALVFTGMEHSLHAFFSVAVVCGLVETLERERPPRWLVAALVVGPLLRFEGLAVSAAALVFLAWLGHLRLALTAGGVLLLCLAAYATLMVRLGLPPLPSSVLAKMPLIADALATEPATDLRYPGDSARLLGRGPVLMLLLGALLALGSWTADDRRSAARLALFAGAVMAIHLLFGRFGLYARYEAYVLLLGSTAAIYVWRGRLRRALSAPRWLPTVLMVLAAFAWGLIHLLATAVVPLAANNIHLQQYQMHRLVTDYWREPVAVNDLGWVSFANDGFVLDLWGLGSERARAARRSAGDAGWMVERAAAHDVGLVMVYEHWFPYALPASWCRVAVLSLEGPTLSVAGRDVGFFATSAAAAQRLVEPLAAFGASLPQGVRLPTGPPLPMLRPP